MTKHRKTMKFPTEEDLNGAAVALIRLQDTYNLEATKLANGDLNGVKYSTKMSASDCFELGRQSYINHDYYHTILWMQETMNRLNFEDEQMVTRENVLEYLAFSNFKEGNTKIALQLTNELLELIPNHDRANGNKIYYEKVLAKSTTRCNRILKGDDDSIDMPIAEYEALLANRLSLINYDGTEKRLYEMMCRGEIKRNIKDVSFLKCMYVTRSLFLKIAPLKLEEINFRPYIVLYHDVMYDKEIQTIQQLAKPRFRRATVQNHKTGELETAHYRISKSAWLKDEDNKVIKDITKRLEDMTGLTMKTAEDLQIVNYGIGGHYEPHFDFARKEEKNAFKSLGTGNRIATVLFYMTDVSQGGATVFPHIRVSLWPKKGSAAFWYNLHEDGEGDYLTRHAACPVLAGTKWVSNRWIHERGQEFLRPCGLNPSYPSTS